MSRPVGRHERPRRRRHAAAPAAICLIAIAAIAVLIFLILTLTGNTVSRPAKMPEAPLAAVLDEDWENWFLTARTTEEQQAYVQQTVADVQSLGGNLILLTGRAGGRTLFRSRDKALPTLETITANDSFLHRKFDPVVFLTEAAREAGIHTALLATDDAGHHLADTQAEQLAKAVEKFSHKHRMQVFYPGMQPVNEDTGLWRYTSGEVTLLRADGKPGLLASAAMQTPGAGAVLGEYTALLQNSDDAAAYLRFAADLPDCWANGISPLLNQPVPMTLAVTYPAEGDILYTEQVFLMGTSDPGQTLTVNGRTVPRQGTRGVWGLLVDAQVGENVITASQGGQETTLTFVRREPNWKPGKPQPDGSVAAKRGQKLRITSPLASVLETPGNPDSIKMTAYEGAVAEVAKSIPATIKGKRTYTYLLQSGHYVLAKDCELIDAPDAAFTGVTVEDLENGDEILKFTGEGTPLYYHSWEGNTLTLTFFSAAFTGQWPASTGFVQSFEPGEVDTGFSVTMEFDGSDPLWGYHVDYVDGGTQIYLKRAPARSSAETGPLTGVTVLLDAGHGDKDEGAMGCAGIEAPQEKDVNLALAIAAKHRLEQLGASVLMTRTDDTFLTLGERLGLVNSEKPDFFISLHHNSAELNQDLNQNSGGVECYWFYTEGKPLAEALVKATGEATGRAQRGTFYNYFYVTRSNICPAVLLEAGFMTVPGEYESVVDEAALWAQAGAIAQAVLESTPG